ncbi:MAG: hypothetical protein SPJ83_07970 [Helicobacter sp.]|nr:hypothetical protein [Helicobacter sp.]MDY5822702.1 hypothetical protein [Helicobacter sp.]
MTDIIVEIGKVWFESEIILLILIVIIFLASKIGFIKILLWLPNKIL